MTGTVPAVPSAAITAAESRFERVRRTITLFAGPLIFTVALVWPTPGLTPEAHRLMAVLLWVLTWWVGEPIPIPATALMGAVLSVILGVAEPAAVFAPFANPVVFLFIGSFLLAEGMIVHGLNERIALGVLSATWLTRSGRGLMVAIGLIPFLISMWISDSATTAMIYPILLGIMAMLRRTGGTGGGDAAGSAAGPAPAGANSDVGPLLTISYAALIGGVATPVGTPPNLIGIGMLDKLAGVHIPFFQWMQLAVPISLVLIALMFLLMARMFPAMRVARDGIETFVRSRRATLGRWKAGERNALIAFLVAVALWVTPGIVASLAGTQSAAYRFFERHIPEGVASLVAGLLLFMLPVDWKERRFTLTWQQAVRIDWGTVLLFGGGLSLGALMFSTGLADALGRQALKMSGVGDVWGLTIVAVVLAVALTEMTSNTATASMLVPVVISLSRSLGVSAVPPAIGVCLGASMAFMLPVSTPSNAIVYGSGRVPVTSMIRAGVFLDMISIVVICVMLRLLCPLLGLM